jgi:hypothetical protein
MLRQLFATVLYFLLTLPAFSNSYNASDQLSMDTYDANGNTTASAGTGYVYDFENHLL